MKTLPHLLLLVLLASAFAPRTQAAESRVITLRSDVEEGKRMLVATVTADGKPVENAKVAFFAQRTFGALALGAEVTLDDGTAAVPFPATLPGDDQGRLRLSAELANLPKGAPRVFAATVFDGGVPFHSEPQGFPRALWAPRAPWILLTVIAVLVGLVWGAFGYVVFQLHQIRKAVPADIPAADLTVNQPVSDSATTSL